MIRLFFILIVLFAAVMLGLNLGDDPGHVIISTGAWRAETTIWVAILLLVIAFFFFHLLCLFLRFVINCPKNLHAWYQLRLMRQAQTKTRQGLIEFSEGYWKSAQKHLIEALPHTDIPLFNYLTAARSAAELGQTQLRDNFLREAQQTEPQANIAVKLTQAQLQIASQQWEQALATLQHLHDIAPKHPYVIKLLTQLYDTVKDWPALIRLLPAIKKYGTLSPQQFERSQRRIYLEALQDLCKQNKQIEPIQHFYKSLPRGLQQDPYFMLVFAKFLCHHQAWQHANTLLKQALSKRLLDELIELYATLPVEEDKLGFAKQLLKTHPHSAHLHFCLGRLNFQARLFGQAKLHFEQSIAIHPDPKMYYYLGETLEALDLTQEAYQAYKHAASKGFV